MSCKIRHLDNTSFSCTTQCVILKGRTITIGNYGGAKPLTHSHAHSIVPPSRGGATKGNLGLALKSRMMVADPMACAYFGMILTHVPCRLHVDSKFQIKRKKILTNFQSLFPHNISCINLVKKHREWCFVFILYIYMNENTPMIEENQQLVINEPVEFEK